MALLALLRRPAPPRLAVVVPDRVERPDEPYVRPAHTVPPSGPSLHLAPYAVTWSRHAPGSPA